MPFPRRLRPVAVSLLAATAIALPASMALPATYAAASTAAQVGSTSNTTTSNTTTPLLPLQSTTTSTTAPPQATTTTTTTSPQAKATTTTTTTTKPGKGGVPAVPVGGPPTTAPAPGAKPAPPPNPDPILTKVDGDLAQLNAIADYKPAQALVANAQRQVTAAGATLLSARQTVDAAKAAQGQAAQGKVAADAKLRDMAIAAYIGVGYTTPGFNQPPQGNGNQGAGTVSTPQGLTGLSAIDAREMLIILGQHARQMHDQAIRDVAAAAKTTQQAEAAYRKDQAAVGAAEAQLLSAQQTLKMVMTAALTPGAAAATPLPHLDSAPAGTPAKPGTTPTAAPTATPTAAPAGLVAASTVVDPSNPTSPPILGPPALDAAQLQAWWATLNRKPNLTVPINQLISSYAAWGAKLGVRYDVAFAQSIVETGFFSFPSYGQLTAKDNNFAGIGACDTCAHGWSFPSADTGVQAQLELLRMYATAAPLPAGVKNVIGGTGVGGCCTSWTQLAGKWASSTVYGISIMTIYDQMLTWAIPQEEVTVGLITPTNPAAQGPSLAPLPPGAKKPATANPGSSGTPAAAAGAKKAG